MNALEERKFKMLLLSTKRNLRQMAELVDEDESKSVSINAIKRRLRLLDETENTDDIDKRVSAIRSRLREIRRNVEATKRTSRREEDEPIKRRRVLRRR